MTQLGAYFAKIEFDRLPDVSLKTLFALHRAHLRHITYENLDVQLGREVSLDLDKVFDKLVVRRRGGWCFEMNHLFAWALREIGFDVRMVCGAVNRAESGDAAAFNHMVLLVELDQTYVADVGFGNGFLEPLPLRAGEHVQGCSHFALERHGAWWRVHHDHGGPSFDFLESRAELADFAAQCHRLQTSPDSGFVRASVCLRFADERIFALRGATLSEWMCGVVNTRVIDSREIYATTLRDVFALRFDVDELDTLWHKAWSSHLAWLESQRNVTI